MFWVSPMLVLALIIPSTMTISSTPPTQPHPFPSHPKRNGDAQTQSTNKAKPRKKHSHKAIPGKKVSPSLEMSKHIPRRHVPISPAIPRTRHTQDIFFPLATGRPLCRCCSIMKPTTAAARRPMMTMLPVWCSTDDGQ